MVHPDREEPGHGELRRLGLTVEDDVHDRARPLELAPSLGVVEGDPARLRAGAERRDDGHLSAVPPARDLGVRAQHGVEREHAAVDQGVRPVAGDVGDAHGLEVGRRRGGRPRRVGEAEVVGRIGAGA